MVTSHLVALWIFITEILDDNKKNYKIIPKPHCTKTNFQEFMWSSKLHTGLETRLTDLFNPQYTIITMSFLPSS